MMRHLAEAAVKSTLSTYSQDQIQPNSIDLRIESVFGLKDSMFEIDEQNKIHRGTYAIRPNKNGYWILEPGTYEVVMEGIVTIAEGQAGWVITRSTLNRNGVFITSGLYDSGYIGVMAGSLHVTSGPMKIAKGTRVGQFILCDADSIGQYLGDYGVDSEHDKKYGKDTEDYPDNTK